VRVLVTGASGFIGAEVVKALVQRGATVWAQHRPDRTPHRLAGLDADRVHLAAARLDRGDDLDRLLDQAGPERLIHLAWHTDPRDYLNSPANQDCVAMTLRLFQAALDAGCHRLVGAGTCLEYGRTEQVRTEDRICAPDTPYGQCKHQAHQQAAKRVASAGAHLAWARIFHLYGPGEASGWLVPSVLASLSRGEPFSLSPGEQRRDWMHVRDVAGALVAIAESDLEGPVNLCTGQSNRLRDLLTPIGTLLEAGELLRFGARAYGEREEMAVLGDPSRLASTGFEPGFKTLAEGMAHTVSAWRSGGWT